MQEERQNTVDALRTAMRMEIEGKEFYTRASEAAGNEAGKKLFLQLAAEEDSHRVVFTRIFEEVTGNRGWPETELSLDGGSALRSIFGHAIQDIQTMKTRSELDAVVKARELESRTYDFYTSRSRLAGDSAEGRLYQRIAEQEQQHSLVLADYYEYLNNPAGWFVKKEHPSLD